VTADSAAAAGRPRSLIPIVLAVLLIPAVLGSSKTIFNDGDVSWHIATGQWIIAHHAIPRTDPFSFTWYGKPWVPIEWLAEVLYAAAFGLARYSGVAALVTAALIALHATVFFHSERFVRPFVALGTLIMMDLVLIPMMLARPHLLAWPLVALWTWLMCRARQQGRAPPVDAALLMTLWANLHGSFIFGFAIAAAFALEALIAGPDRGRALRQWLVFGIACVVAVFINANGIEGVFHPLRFTHLQMLPLIDEWKPSNVRTTPFFFAVLAIAIVLIAWKRPRLPWPRWLLLAALLAMALLQMRHQAVLAIVAAMLLPSGFAAAPTGLPDRRIVVFAAAAAALLVVVRAVMPLSPPENDANPWKLIAAVPPQLRSEPVLNGYSMGGPLILSGIRPYVDGRGDMYGDALVVGYARIVHGDPVAFTDAVRRWNIRWAIVPNRDKALIAMLARSPDWRLLASDDVGVIYVRSAD
jgi:hypothetical protein